MESWMLISPRRAAELGDPKAMVELGVLYTKGEGGVEQDYAEAAKWFYAAAQKGSAAGQNHLGELYGTGDGVKQSFAEALKWIRMAAEQGYPEAQFNVGYMYGKGQGVAQDFVRATMWFEIAARQGFKEAAKYRDTVAKKIRPGQIAEAKRLARDWLDQHGGK
jgi:TPR repeat protein